MKRGKKYQDAVKSFDKANQYDVAEAISLVKKNATAKFDETIDAELRESGYCQYGYIDEEDNIIAEMTEQQKEEWLNYTVNDINRIIGQGEEGFYSFKFTHNYEELQLEISKEILNGKTTTHTALVMSLIYDSEIYQVLNGKTDWAIHIVGKDLETGGELMNINFPEEGNHISIENWDNM